MFEFQDERFEEQAEICRRSYESSLECLFKFVWRPLCRGLGWKNIYFCRIVLCSELCCGIVESTWWVLHRILLVLHSHILGTFLRLYVPALNLLPLHLKPQMGHLKIVSRFSSCGSLRTANLLGRLHVPTRPAPIFRFRYQQGWILNQEE